MPDVPHELGHRPIGTGEGENLFVFPGVAVTACGHPHDRREIVVGEHGHELVQMRTAVGSGDDGGAAREMNGSGLEGPPGIPGQVGQLERGGRGVFVTPANRFRRVGARPVAQPTPAEVQPEDVGSAVIDLHVLEPLDQLFTGVAQPDVPEGRAEGTIHEPLDRIGAKGSAGASPHVDDQVVIEQLVPLRDFHQVHDVLNERAFEIQPLQENDPLVFAYVDKEVLPFQDHLEAQVLRLRPDGVRVGVPVGQGHVVTVAGSVLQRQVQGFRIEVGRDAPHHHRQLTSHVPVEAVGRGVPDPLGELLDVLSGGPTVHADDTVPGFR